MPRRPRPASRRRPPNGTALSAPQDKAVTKQSPNSKSNSGKSAHRHRIFEEEGQSGSHSDFQDEEDDLDDVDADAARVAQWVDDEELDGASEGDSDSDDASAAEGPSHLTADLALLPFGALRKAQRALTQASALSESEYQSDNQELSGDDDDETEQVPSKYDLKGKGKEIEDAKKPRKDIPKRTSKHAPTEVTSKRPVARKKLATEGEKIIPRDPRFLPLAGEFSSKQFHSQYGFLSELHTEEMKTLKANLKRARKLLASSPRDLREERMQEVQRLERAVKRAESMVNKDRREKVEEEALSKIARQEREKRKEGKGAWYMKKSDKKELLLRAKYENLAADGGKGAVRKAIEKKQKKDSQKEKKKRPFALERPGEAGGPSRKRPRVGFDDDRRRSGKRERLG
ncbi:hypothetical protein AcV7_000684 [Taiwanofungus camphoratus]|nr:hypothetical protein AcW2_000836 [Antrodia cinnamomea]KAI0961634.1 hypothetical protein AcV7_000684 [Antrodia cinnamomea]